MKRFIAAIMVLCVSCLILPGCVGWSGEKIATNKVDVNTLDPNYHSTSRPDSGWKPSNNNGNTSN